MQAGQYTRAARSMWFPNSLGLTLMRTRLTLIVFSASLLLVVILMHGGAGGHRENNDKSIGLEPKASIAGLLALHRGAITRLNDFQLPRTLPATLLAPIQAESDPERRSEALDEVARSVPIADLRDALNSIAGDLSPEAAELRPLLARRWAEADPGQAAAWASALPEGPDRRAALEQVAIAYAGRDVPSATGWVAALPEGDDKQAATLTIAYEASRNEPVEALDLASTLAPSPQRDDLLVHAISQWSGIDSTNAAAWALNVTDHDLQQRLIAAVAIASAQQNGLLAATLAASRLGTGDEQDRASVSIVQRWAQQAPEAAAEWVSQFPATPSRDAAVENLLAIWIGRDAAAAGNWVNELPPGSLRDVGSAAYSQVVAQLAPASSPSGVSTNIVPLLGL